MLYHNIVMLVSLVIIRLANSLRKVLSLENLKPPKFLLAFTNSDSRSANIIWFEVGFINTKFVTYSKVLFVMFFCNI